MTSSISSSRVLSPISSSFDFLSSNVHSQEASESSDSYASVSSDEVSSNEDEIIWSFSDISSGSPALRSQRALSPSTFSDEDIIVVSRPRSRAFRFQSMAGTVAEGDDDVERLAKALAKIEIKQVKPTTTKKASKKAASVPTTPTSPSTSTRRRNRGRKQSASTSASPSEPRAPIAKVVPSSPKKKNGKKAASAPSPNQTPVPVAQVVKATEDDGLGERPIVDDVSEAGDSNNVVPAYEAAQEYVTSVLSDPSPKKASNLAFLHALIIELGLIPANHDRDTLPRSLRAAKSFLKSHVFLNVKDYLALRHQGLDALRQVMHPSKKALIKDVRSKSSRKVPRDVVKNSGLGVLLVTTHH